MRRCDFLSEKALLIDAPDMAITLAVRIAVAAVDHGHDFAERILFRLNQNMIMIGHETPSDNSKRIAVVDIGEGPF